MNAQITELFDRLSAKERTDLLAGLKRLDQRRSAEDALMTASLLESQLKLLGLREYAEMVVHIQEQIRDLI